MTLRMGYQRRRGPRLVAPASLNPLPTTDLIRRFSADLGVTKDGGNLVSAWADQMGSGHNLAQATGANQPIWAASQFGTLPGITFDGADDTLSVATGTIAKPLTLYALMRQITWTHNNTLLDGFPGGGAFQVYQNSSSAQLAFYTGATGPRLDGMVIDTNSVGMWIANGTSSATRLNLDAANVGGDSDSVSLVGITLGGLAAFATFGNVRFGEILIYQAAHDTEQQDAVIRYLAQRGGISL